MSVTQDKAGVVEIAGVTLAHNVFPVRPGTGASSAATCASYSVPSGSRLTEEIARVEILRKWKW